MTQLVEGLRVLCDITLDRDNPDTPRRLTPGKLRAHDEEHRGWLVELDIEPARVYGFKYEDITIMADEDLSDAMQARAFQEKINDAVDNIPKGEEGEA